MNIKSPEELGSGGGGVLAGGLVRGICFEFLNRR